MDEEFKEIEGFPGYQVGTHGHVMNSKFSRIMTITRDRNNGWALVGLFRDGKQHMKSVAYLVARAFLEEPVEPKTSILHRDGDRMNNRVTNLVWAPRWFVVMYMREMKHPAYYMEKPFRSETTGEIFRSIADFSALSLELPSNVFRALNEGSVYFPVYGTLNPISWKR